MEEKTELMTIDNIRKRVKDAGKKLCAINKLEDSTMIHPVIKRLLTMPDISI